MCVWLTGKFPWSNSVCKKYTSNYKAWAIIRPVPSKHPSRSQFVLGMTTKPFMNSKPQGVLIFRRRSVRTDNHLSDKLPVRFLAWLLHFNSKILHCPIERHKIMIINKINMTLCLALNSSPMNYNPKNHKQIDSRSM